MKVQLICIGKTDDRYLQEGIDKYVLRLKHYANFQLTIIPDVKNGKHLSIVEQRVREGLSILKQIKPSDYLCLLDESGESCSSVAFANTLNKWADLGKQKVVFVIGGPYGFDKDVYNRADKMLSLSKMTFSHQMIRLFFVEQTYRAFTILRGEPYHHA